MNQITPPASPTVDDVLKVLEQHAPDAAKAFRKKHGLLKLSKADAMKQIDRFRDWEESVSHFSRERTLAEMEKQLSYGGACNIAALAAIAIAFLMYYA